MYLDTKKINDILRDAQTVVIIQADNPDADSLGSALALEQIIGDMGKTPILYCGSLMPTYLHYLVGWDRVESELPVNFEATIVVDASTTSLLEKIKKSGYHSLLAKKPCIVLDHHATVDNLIDYATVTINDPTVSSTGELIYHLAQQVAWTMSLTAQEFLMTAILGDTQGLSNQLARAATFRVMGDMLENGVDRQKLEELRREYSKMPQAIYGYKARLMERTKFELEGKLAYVIIPQTEITAFSPLYNPAPLIQGDMLQTKGVLVSIVFKDYADSRITAAIRCNRGGGIAGQLALSFGGGGHDYASGFKINNGRNLSDVISDCLKLTNQLLSESEEYNSKQ